MATPRDDALNAVARAIANDLERLTRKHTLPLVIETALPFSRWLLLAAGGLLGTLIANLDAVIELAGRLPTVAAAVAAVVSAALGGLVNHQGMKLGVEAGVIDAEDSVEDELLKRIGKHLEPIPELTPNEVAAVSHRALDKIARSPLLLRPVQESTALKGLQKRLRMMGRLLDFQLWMLLLSGTIVVVAALWA